LKFEEARPDLTSGWRRHFGFGFVFVDKVDCVLKLLGSSKCFVWFDVYSRRCCRGSLKGVGLE
jgi:hypothetical protein